MPKLYPTQVDSIKCQRIIYILLLESHHLVMQVQQSYTSRMPRLQRLCSTARRLTSAKLLGRLRLSDLLKDPGPTPFLNAYTIMGSSVVPTFTTCAPKRLMYSFRVSSSNCFTSKRSYETGVVALLAKYCSLNSRESYAKDVM